VGVALIVGLGLSAAVPAVSAAALATFEFAKTGSAAPAALGTDVSSVAVDADGNVWIADPTNARLAKYDYNGKFIGALSAPIGGGPPFTSPEGIAADAAGFLYVVQGAPDTPIIKIDTGGTFVRTIGPDGPGGTNLTAPSAVAVDSATGRLYVADGFRIAIYDANGVPAGAIPVSSPTGVAVSGGDVYVARTSAVSGQEVVRFPGGAPPEVNIGAGLFTGTIGELAVDSAGRLYVADGGGSIIRRFDSGGAQIDTIGTSGTNDREINIPTSVALDCRDNLYVVDSGSIAGGGPASKALKYTTSNTPPPCAPRPPAPGAVDLQINDVEVSQGIQPERNYTAGPPPSDAPLLGDIPEIAPRTRGYGPPEVPLQANGKTVVRVFANLRGGSNVGISPVPATLEGFSGGRSLGVIQPDAKPAAIPVGTTTVTTAQRTDPAGAYTFSLPQPWTAAGTIDLVARVNPAGIGCEGPCVNRTTFRLTNVTFEKTIHPKVVPIAITHGGVFPDSGDGVPIYDPHPLFDTAQIVAPVELDIYGYHAFVEAGDLIDAQSVTVEDCFLGIDLGILCTDDTYTPDKPEYREYLQGELMDRIEDAADDAGIDDCDKIPIGIIGPGNNSLAGVMRGEWENKGFFQCAFGYAAAYRPLTSVAHEIQHAFARPHASKCNATPGQEGEDWPPDERGDLQGIGIDPRMGSGGAFGPLRIIYANVGGIGGEVYDLMSYCANVNTDGDSWISPRGWGAVLRFRQDTAKARPAVARPVAARQLHVTAMESSSGVLGITGVSPSDGAPEPVDPASAYFIEARDAAGTLLTSAPANASTIDDSGGVLIEGDVPAPKGTEQVLVWRGTEAGTRRVASPTAPKVKLQAPRGGSTAGGKNLTVRWSATDPDPDPLEATVSYAADGKHFSAVYKGPAATGAAQIRRSLLHGSDKAKVRVSVDDGFHVDTATSKPFTVVSSAPTVRISDPVGPVTIGADASLSLSGSASGAGGTPVRAKALRWVDGKNELGRGESVSVSGLKPGNHKITLLAKGDGRTGRASVAVTVTPVKPEFLVLSGPPSVSAKAKNMKITVATNVTAKMRVGKKTFKVYPEAFKYKVAVPKGKGTFALPITLKAAGQETIASVVVLRG
jgi:sugar lactone lactonase YvrE